MKKIFLAIIGFGLCLVGCQSPATKMLQDIQIDAGLKDQVNSLNTQLIKAFASQDPNKVLPLCSDKLASKGAGTFMSVMQQVGNRFKVSNYHIKNQFYVQHAHEGTISQVSTGKGHDDYTISFQAANADLLVTVGYFKGDIEDLALTTVYGKYGSSWKLNIMQVGLMTIKGKTAYNWYEQAQADLNKGYLADAADDMVLCNLVNKPANQFWHYAQEQQFTAFDQKLNIALNKAYKFPVTVSAVPSHPQIFRLYPQGMNQGYFPMILYKSTISQKDTVALSKECDQLNQNIGKVFKGIDMGKKYMFYRAYEKLPAGNEQAASHGFVRKGKFISLK